MGSRVPHLTFEGALPQDPECEYPPGASLARMWESHLRAQFESVESFDNWRDVGWRIGMQINGASFEIYYALFQPDQGLWLLAIAPRDQPGFIARLFGSRPAEDTATLRSICMEIHSAVLKTPGLSRVQWFFGGPPGKVSSVCGPEQLPWG